MKTTINLNQIVFAASALLGVVATSVPALAADPDAAPRIELVTGGYDMTNNRDVTALANRARQAAKSVCFREQTRDLKQNMDQRRCFDHAVTDANRQIAALQTARLAARANGMKTASADRMPVGIK